MAKKTHIKAPTRKAKEKYIRTGGVRCIFCASEQIEGGPFECEAGTVWQAIRCLDCNQEWIDIHHLSDVQNPDWPDEPSRLKKGSRTHAIPTGRKKLLFDLCGVDWKMLRRQKESLLRVIDIANVQVGKKCREDMQGILHLLDCIQDQAAEHIGERAVFGHGKNPHP